MAATLPKDEKARLAALREYQILDTGPEDAYDDIARLAAFVCGTPIAGVTLIDADRQWFKSVVGDSVKEIPRGVAFCAHAILQHGLMVVPDTERDARFADNPFVTGHPHVRFYAGAPLIAQDGHALGSLCVLDSTPRHLTPEQGDALQALARQAVGQMEMRRRVAQQERLIGEREAAQERARVREDELRRLAGAVAGATVGIVVADARQDDLPITYANPTFLALTGYPGHEVVGRNCRFLQGPETDPEAVRRIRAALDAGADCRVTLLNYRKDGTAFWNELTIAPIRDASGALTEFIGTQHDITALKETEAALIQKEARLVQAQRIGRLGDWELDVTTRGFTWSEEVFRLMGFDPDRGTPPYEEVLSRYDPGDRAARELLVERGIATGEPYQGDLRFHLPGGGTRWCQLVGRPVRDDRGRVTRVVGTIQDITDRVEREQRSREANLLLEVKTAQLQAANADLAALATADPLTGLLNYRAFQSRFVDEAERARREGGALAVALLDLTDFRFFNDVYGHAVGDTVLRRVAARLSAVCAESGLAARFGGDEFTVLLPCARDVAAYEVEARLRVGLGGLSYLPDGGPTAIPISVSVGVALYPQDSADGQEVLRLAETRLGRAKAGGAGETEADRVRTHAGRSLKGFSMLDALVTAVDNKDRYTRRHSEDVMAHSLMIARRLGMDEETQHTVAVAALLHDVGKIGVPDHILRKPGRLTDEEFEAVKQHPQMGAIMVTAVPGLEQTLDAVRHHHERWDGDGYPFGLRGEETPLVARLMAVADAFSAMTTDRPYRKGMPHAEALSILEAGAGSQWDPQCVHAFLRARRTSGAE